MNIIKNFSIISIILTWTCLSMAVEVGFSTGEIWSYIHRDGLVSYECYDGQFNRNTSQSCTTNIYLPNKRDYFQHPPLSSGNIVKLIVNHPEGPRTQIQKWNHETGMSLEPFELFYLPYTNNTLLLHDGVNEIRYQIWQGSEYIKQGSFTVKVIADPPKKCYVTLPRPISDFYRCNNENICKFYLEDISNCL